MKQALEGEKVKLRALEPEDAKLLYAWENDSSIWRISNTVTPFSKDVIKSYLSKAHQDIYTNKQLRLIIETVEDTEAIGCIDLFDFDPLNDHAGIGILISNDQYRGEGYADDTLKVMITYAFETLHLHQLYCTINTQNKNSLKLFKKHGFEVNGVQKQWVKTADGYEDVHFLQLINE